MKAESRQDLEDDGAGAGDGWREGGRKRVSVCPFCFNYHIPSLIPPPDTRVIRHSLCLEWRRDEWVSVGAAFALVGSSGRDLCSIPWEGFLRL